MTVKEFNTCVDLYSDGLYRFVLKNIKDDEKAKDIIQDTFEKFWHKKDSVQEGKEKSYLFTSAYRTMIDAIRKEKYSANFNEVSEQQYSSNSQYSDLQEILMEAVDRLPEKQKSVVMLRDYEGYSYEEIAEITDLSESQVKVYIFRARKFLKNYIGSIEHVL